MDDARKLAEDAQELKNNPAFRYAVSELRKQWFGELMALEPIGSDYPLTAALRCAMLRSLESIPSELQRYINNYKFEQDRKRGGN